MQNSIQRSALLMYSARELYELVNDVESYPLFMEGCSSAEILQRGADFMVARLELGRGGLRYAFTTRNTLQEPETITMSLVDGPFRALSGEWAFTPLAERACKVSLSLEFEFKSVVAGLATAGLFNKVANNLLDAVVERAALIYGQ